ncbi:MAG TPA: SMP-30/gluconolactonase/LRE family protein [Candidatus Binataceae bacterium]|nr:SMP-30/gluconolactonase/LRE family protein [Candidatus Binataceae bacterium]
MAEFKVLLDGLMFTEGPRWHDGKLFFSDMHAHKVMSVDLEGKAQTVVEVPTWPSGLGWLPDGRMLIVSMTDRKLLRLDPDGLKTHADLDTLASFYCNDMVVDGKGRAYVGNFGYDLLSGEPQKPAELILVNPDGSTRVAADGFDFPNGTVISPEGNTLVVGESMGHRLTAFNIQSDGSLTNRRPFADLGEAVPDGIALDAEGAIWGASPMSKELLRVRYGGAVAERLTFDTMPIACALGGPERRTLFMLTSDSINPDECRAKKASKIWIKEVAVAGAGWP